MSFLSRKSRRSATPEPPLQRTIYVGKIRAAQYAAALRDPNVRAILAKARAGAKTVRHT
jgi:hypothetical protein